jgi:hypothetical protein
MPGGESWCFYDVNAAPTSFVDSDGDGAKDITEVQLGTEVWYLVGIDDPNFSWK